MTHRKDNPESPRERALAALEDAASGCPVDCESLASLIADLNAYQAQLDAQSLELQQARAEVEESRRKHADLFRYAPLGYVVLDKAGLIRDANQAAVGLFDIDRATLVGSPLSMHSFHSQKELFLLLQAAEGGQAMFEMQFKSKRRDMFWARVDCRVVPDWGSGGIHFLASLVDVTDTRLAWEEIRARQMDLDLEIDTRTVELSAINEELRAEIQERLRTEEELRSRERELQLVHRRLDFHMQNSPLALIEWDAELRCTRWSQRAEEIFGWTAADVLGRRPLEWRFVHEDDQARGMESLEALLAGERHRKVSRHRNYRKSGDWISCEWYESALMGDDGQLISILSMVQDVTEQAEAVNRIRKSERKFRAIFELSSDGISIYERKVGTRKRRLLDFNESYALMAGREREALLAIPDIRAIQIHEHDDGQSNRYQESVEEGRPYGGTFSWIRPDGRENIIEYKAVPVREGDRILVYGMDRDITERTRVAREMAESEARFRAIFEQARVGICQLDPNGRVLRANQSFMDALGWSWKQLKGYTLIDFTHPDEREATQEAQRRLMSGEIDTYNLEKRYVGKDGRVVWCNVSNGAVRSEDGEVMYQIVVAEDITERKRMEDALLQEEVARAAAEEASRVKDEFLSFISHELRTPLTGIIGFAQTIQNLLARGRLTEEGLNQYLGYIVDSGRHLSSIIEDVLDVARIEAGRMRIIFEPVDLEFLLHSLRPDLESRAQEKGLSFNVSLGPGIPTVRADPKRLAQVLYNLIGNAIKFTDTGGVNIRADLLPDPGDMVMITVEDTGAGMKDIEISRIFERFTRLESSGNVPGSGLGLHIAKRMVEMMGGAIWVESEVGKGSRFQFILGSWFDDENPLMETGDTSDI